MADDGQPARLGRLGGGGCKRLGGRAANTMKTAAHRCPARSGDQGSPVSREYSVIYELRRRGILPRPGCLLHRQQPGCGRPPLKKKDFKEERVAKFGLYDIGKSTTLESNKSLLPTWLKQSARSKTPSRGRLPS